MGDMVMVSAFLAAFSCIGRIVGGYIFSGFTNSFQRITYGHDVPDYRINGDGQYPGTEKDPVVAAVFVPDKTGNPSGDSSRTIVIIADNNRLADAFRSDYNPIILGGRCHFSGLG